MASEEYLYTEGDGQAVVVDLGAEVAHGALVDAAVIAHITQGGLLEFLLLMGECVAEGEVESHFFTQQAGDAHGQTGVSEEVAGGLAGEGLAIDGCVVEAVCFGRADAAVDVQLCEGEEAARSEIIAGEEAEARGEGIDGELTKGDVIRGIDVFLIAIVSIEVDSYEGLVGDE